MCSNVSSSLVSLSKFTFEVSRLSNGGVAEGGLSRNAFPYFDRNRAGRGRPLLLYQVAV